MHKQLEISFQAALDEAKLKLQEAFSREKGKAVAASGAGALGGSRLYIAYQKVAEAIASELVAKMLESVELISAKYDLNKSKSHRCAVQFFNDFVLHVLHSYDAEILRSGETRRVSAPALKSSLFRVPRQKLSAGFSERLARTPMSQRVLKIVGFLRPSS